MFSKKELETQREVKLAVRFVDEEAEKRHLDLYVRPTMTLAQFREQLAKETGTARAEWIVLSLQGRPLSSSLEQTLQQVYGGASVFGSAVDARVEAPKEEKTSPTKTPSNRKGIVLPAAQATTNNKSSAVAPPTASGMLIIPNHSGYHVLNEDKHDSELQCQICKGVLLDPVVLPCCENTLCRGCLRTDSCPFDRGVVDVAKVKEPLRLVRNMLERVEVQCKDCQRVMKRGLKGELFAKHALEECPVVCVHGCGQSVTRAAMSAHESKCTHRVVPCSAADVGCQYVGARGTLADHERTCQSVLLAPLARRIDVLERKNAALEAFVKRQFPGWKASPASAVQSGQLADRAPGPVALLGAKPGKLVTPVGRPPSTRTAGNSVNNPDCPNCGLPVGKNFARGGGGYRYHRKCAGTTRAVSTTRACRNASNPYHECTPFCALNQ